MKNILVFIVLAVIAVSSPGAQVESLSMDQVKLLPPDKRHEFWKTVHRQVLASEKTAINGEIVQIDLIFAHENLTNNPEIRLVANENGKEYILWWVDTDGMIPIEFQIAIEEKNSNLGFCFECGSSLLLFYEINIKKALQEAKNENIRLAPSSWVMSEILPNEKDIKQEIVLHKIPNLDKDVVWASNLKLKEEMGQWMFSFDAKRLVLPITRYWYKYPVGGTGLTFVKKETVPAMPEGEKKCQQNLHALQQAKQLWAAINEKKPGDLVDTNVLFIDFLRVKELKCPDYGIYDIGLVGEPPKCSVHGVFKP